MGGKNKGPSEKELRQQAESENQKLKEKEKDLQREKEYLERKIWEQEEKMRKRKELLQYELEKERIEFMKKQEHERIMEKRKKEYQKKENYMQISNLRNNQDITLFLALIEKFNNDDDSDYMKKTLEALNEKEIIKKYKYLKNDCSGKIQIIRANLYGDYVKEISEDCLRKLVILLFCYEKSNNNNNLDEVLNKLIENNLLKDLIFDILLDYSKEFGKDILFENRSVYKELVAYSIKKGQYLQSLDYLSNDIIIQLKLLNEQKEKIFQSEINVTYNKLNVYDEAFKVVQDLIQYEKGKKKFIFFPKHFWENLQSLYD